MSTPQNLKEKLLDLLSLNPNRHVNAAFGLYRQYVARINRGASLTQPEVARIERDHERFSRFFGARGGEERRAKMVQRFDSAAMVQPKPVDLTEAAAEVVEEPRVEPAGAGETTTDDKPKRGRKKGGK